LLFGKRVRGEFSRLACIVGAVPYGFSYFAITVEGQTAAMGIVAALALSAWITRQLRKGEKNAFSVFFLSALLLALALYLFWFMLHGGLPQFSEVGLLQ
jgi:hypothetical protein